MYEPSAGKAASYLTHSICGFLSIVNMEEVRTGERLKMRHWLTNAIESGDFDGVEWTDKSDGKFRVPWKHASRHGWDIDRDASIFKMWAIYTGKYSSKSKHLTEKEKRSLAKLWKANFRCALNALQDIQVLKGEGKSRGRDAYKVFRLLQPKKQTNKFTKVRSVSASEFTSLSIFGLFFAIWHLSSGSEVCQTAKLLALKYWQKAVTFSVFPNNSLKSQKSASSYAMSKFFLSLLC